MYLFSMLSGLWNCRWAERTGSPRVFRGIAPVPKGLYIPFETEHK